MYRVIKDFFIVDKNTNYKYDFPIDTEIEYQRISNRTIRIAYEYPYPIDSNMECENFDIENFVEPIEESSQDENSLRDHCKDIYEAIKLQEEYTKVFNQGIEIGKSMKEELYTVQFKICDCIANANRFSSTIPGKNFIDIKPIKDNCWLIVYKEYNNVSWVSDVSQR